MAMFAGRRVFFYITCLSPFEIAYKLHTLVPLQVPSLFLIHEAVGYWWGLARPRGFFGRVGWVGDGFCFGTEEDEKVGWLCLL